jgi:hypothetical protein
VLIMLEPDLGTTITLAASLMALLFVGGCASPLLPAAASARRRRRLLYFNSYQRARVMTFLDPWSVARGKGYQTVQAFLALGRGGIAGTGPAGSRQKLFFLPAPHTDFILAVIGEELGFIGLLGVVVLFGVILWRGMRIALRAPDLFGTYLAFGLTFCLFLQAVINIMVVAGHADQGLTLRSSATAGTCSSSASRPSASCSTSRSTAWRRRRTEAMGAARTFGLAVAGGGTGGHIFPGLAVAREFRRREPGTRVLYLGAAGRLEERVVPREGAAVRFHGLRVRGLKGQAARRAVGAALPRAGRCRREIAAFGADLFRAPGPTSAARRRRPHPRRAGGPAGAERRAGTDESPARPDRPARLHRFRARAGALPGRTDGARREPRGRRARPGRARRCR